MIHVRLFIIMRDLLSLFSCVLSFKVCQEDRKWIERCMWLHKNKDVKKINSNIWS